MMTKQALLKMAEGKGLRMIREEEDGFILVGKDAQGRPVLVGSRISNGKPSVNYLGTVDGRDASQWLQEVA
jgi:hypothetical protein